MNEKPTLGRFRITGELGRGAMGVIYKGEDTETHRTVAIKTVRFSQFDPEILVEMKERFFREAESARLLQHPNIITILDCGEQGDLAYIAMEFLDGEDLEDYTANGNLLPLRDTLAIVCQVAEALDFAHRKGIVHRDIKPANIMLIKGTQDLKVADFGVARIISSSKTKTGVILGTPAYMSPEQVAGDKVDGRSDIFSLGVVLYETLTGRRPFLDENMIDLMYKIVRDPHPPVDSLNPQIPPVVVKIVDKALEKEPDSRYQKAGHVAQHLKKVISRLDEIRAKNDSA